MHDFPEIGLLITHFNRSMSLEKLLTSLESLGCSFGQIIVSDDASSQEHIKHIENLMVSHPFQLIKASENMGLGTNINKGQDAINTPYTLYVQEDFEPTSLFPSCLKEALQFMDKDQGLDIVRFYAYSRYPTLVDLNKGFSEMIYDQFSLNYRKIYYYSDHPHLRRNTFFSKFGRYKEGKKSDRTEYQMCLSFIQNKGKGLFFNNFKTLFTQENSLEEPSTVIRSNWRQSDNRFLSIVRDLYRQVKYNYDIRFTKAKVT